MFCYGDERTGDRQSHDAHTTLGTSAQEEAESETENN